MPTLSLTLDGAIYAGLERRAKALGKRPSEYGAQLFNAAYAARVGQEKGMPADDAELDAAVRAVFCLAGDREAPAIARATGFPLGLVQNILAGFSIVARTLAAPAGGGTGQAKAAATETPPALPPAAAQTAGGEGASSSPAVPPPAPSAKVGCYPVELIRKLWAEGMEVRDIAKRIGKTPGAMSVWASNNRDVCPSRRAPKPDRASGEA